MSVAAIAIVVPLTRGPPSRDAWSPILINYLVASIYSPKKIVDSVASTIVVSTLMSFITVPIVVFFALKYFN